MRLRRWQVIDYVVYPGRAGEPVGEPWFFFTRHGAARRRNRYVRENPSHVFVMRVERRP